MKYQSMKNRIVSAIKASLRPMSAVLLVAVLAIGLFSNRPINAASDRAKKVAGVFIGGGAGGGIAAIAGSAKWFPLGFGVGGLAGGLIARHIIKKRKQRAESHAPYESRRKRRGSRRAFQDGDQFEQQPAVATRRHIKMNSNY